ncbi:MAG TPA: aminotransferase class V-fold PLP-dependent enzyme, partial [Candidatus Sulfotelmatobacter sp.]|nr:aminotransferase class V-fold PLP-dependent enzyme [Candidatus Sulfotelmatobacter sp.]
VPGIVGLARAVELAQAERAAEAARLGALRDRLEAGLMARMAGVLRNGHPAERLPNTSSLAFAGAEAESVLVALDLQGVAASSGAACSSGSLAPSHVLTAMRLPREQVESSVRFSLGRATRSEEIDRLLEILPPIIERMRGLRPALARARA